MNIGQDYWEDAMVVWCVDSTKLSLYLFYLDISVVERIINKNSRNTFCASD